VSSVHFPSLSGNNDAHSGCAAALTGYVNPQWTDAEAIFVTSPAGREVGEDGGDEGDEDVVTEIRLRWRRLGKVASFKRVIL
jgi:hypothetical protein